MSAKSTDKAKLPGVEKFLDDYRIGGAAADQVRQWALEALYWNALMLMDQRDIAVIVCGADSHAEMEEKFRERLNRRLGL
jgi:hypothetical protein